MDQKVRELRVRVLGALEARMTTEQLVVLMDAYTKDMLQVVDRLHCMRWIQIHGWGASTGQPRAIWVARAGEDAPKPRRVWAPTQEDANA